MKITKVVVLAAILLGACQGLQNSTGLNSEQQGGLFGGATGGALGGFLGNKLGHGSGTTTAIGAVGGVVAGYFVGSAIGSRLDAADQKKAAGATEKVLKEPVHRQNGQLVAKQQDWSNKKNGTSGSSEVVEVQKQPSGGECRTVKEVAYIHGDEVSQNTKYCKDASGDWQARAI